MLVLAQGNNDTVIVQMKESELAQLLGFYSTWDDGYKKIKGDKIIGKELDVAELYKGYKTIREMKVKKKSILTSIKELEEAVKSVNEVHLTDPEPEKK